MAQRPRSRDHRPFFSVGSGAGWIEAGMGSEIPDIYDAIEGIRAGGEVHVLAIGNPTAGGGAFYDASHRGRASWHTVTISAFDTPNLYGFTIPGVRGPPRTAAASAVVRRGTRCRAPALSGDPAVGRGEVSRVGPAVQERCGESLFPNSWWD